MDSKGKFLILTDNIPGNANQARRLREICEIEAEEFYLDYSIMASFPNIIPFGLFRLKHESRKKLLSCAPPEFIISSGRRAAAIALEIKKICPKVKIIQVMNPDLTLNLFDLVILPQHDKKPKFDKYKNILWIDGAITNPDVVKLKSESKKLYKHYHLDENINICSMIIGGSTGRRSITLENVEEMIKIVTRYINTHKYILVISTSRRTGSNIIKYLENYIKSHLDSNILLYKYSPDSIFNPYWGMIGASSIVIATADSISMCSEIASCGKPLFLYGRTNMMKKKHERFMNNLIERGIAKNVAFGIQNYTPSEFNQTEMIKKCVHALVFDNIGK